VQGDASELTISLHRARSTSDWAPHFGAGLFSWRLFARRSFGRTSSVMVALP
jgi:hypothetical protein